MANEQHNTAPGYRPWLHRFALGTAGATFLLIIAGALVTSHDAGLSVPDWPLSYGQWMPPMSGGVLYEHGHRMVASFVGLLTILMAVWLWRVETRQWLRRLGWVLLVAVILQGLLGGLTVLFLLPWYISVSHAALAQLFFCLTASVALFTGRGWMEPIERTTVEGPVSLPRLSLLTTAAIFIQLVLGASLRHQAIGVTPHLLWAFAVAGLAGWTQWLALSQGTAASLRRAAMALTTLVVLQLGLGLAAYMGRLSTADTPQTPFVVVGITVVHVSAGALALATSVLLTLLAYRQFGTDEEAVGWIPAAGKLHP